MIFFTYLYAPTVLGLEVAPARSILVSTAHDEPAIRLEIFKDVFRRAGGALLPDRERARVRHQQIFHDRPLHRGGGRRRRRDLPQQQPYPRMPAGADEEPAPTGQPATPAMRDAQASSSDGRPRLATFRRTSTRAAPCFRRRHQLVRSDRALRRADRSGKGLRGADSVLQRIREGRRRRDAGADGRQADVAARRIRSSGFAGLLIGPRARCRRSEAATVVVCPSPYESLSLLALEALAVGTPVAGQRAQRRPGRALRAQQRRPLLRGSRRVRRVR